MSLVDKIVHWRKKLQRTTDEEIILSTIHKLSKVPITWEVLQETDIGNVLRSITKQTGKPSSKATALLHKWREALSTQMSSSVAASRPNSKSESSKNNDSSTGKSSEKPSSHKEKHKVKVEIQGKHTTNRIPETSHVVNGKTKDHVSSKKLNGEYKSHKEDGKHSHRNESINDDSLKSNGSIKSEGYISSSKVFANEQSEVENVHMQKRLRLGTDEESSLLQNKSDKKSSESSHRGDKDLKKSSKSEPVKDKKRDKSHHSSSDHKRTEHGSSGVHKSKLVSDSPGQKQDKSHHSSSNHKTSEHGSPHVHKSKPVSDSLGKDPAKSHRSSSSHKRDEPGSSHVQKPKSVPDSSGKDKEKHSRKDKDVTKVHSKEKKRKQLTEEMTAESFSFEDCLNFNDNVVKKKKPKTTVIEKKEKDTHHKKEKKPKSVKAPAAEERATVHEDFEMNDTLPTLLMEPPSPKKLDLDIISTLPLTTPNYRPLPQRSYDTSPSKVKTMTTEEAIQYTSSRKDKTAVYSGKKVKNTGGIVPSLFESCIRILVENMDSIEYMGEIPYFLLKPVLARCNAQQLHRIEYFNPHLVEESQELWEELCKKDFRSKKLEENETWRDLYWRAHDERNIKLKNLTANICASMSKYKPARQVKLAYVDSFVKPPRDVARRQAKHGTSQAVVHNPKIEKLAKPVAPKPEKPVSKQTTAAPVAVASPVVRETTIKMKPKVAPLMAKSLKSLKQCYRR